MLLDAAPSFTLRLAGQPFEVWTDMSIARSIERMSGEFTVKLTRKKKDGDIYLDNAIKPGTEVKVEIDAAPVLDGWIDGVAFSYDAGSTSISVTGRDKTGDLIDCAARVDNNFEFTNQKLDAVVKKILAPFGIPLIVETDVGAAFPRLAVQPGETAFAFIDRACKHRGVLAISNGIGGLIITKPHGEKSAGRLVYGENILKGDIDLDDKERFSLYVIKGQAEPFAPDTDAVVTAAQEARTTDKDITRYRPKVIVGENQGYNMTLKQRVEWEKKMAIARSRKATYSVQGWYADPAKKTLWKPNTVLRVIDKYSGLDREMLIVGISFARTGQQGTTAQLELVLPEALDLPALKAEGGNNQVWAADND